LIEWGESLVEAIARRRAVIFIGAGVSMGSKSTAVPMTRPPGWQEFLERCLTQFHGDQTTVKNLIDTGDYLTACEIIKANLGEEWPRALARAFSQPGYQPAAIHRSIFQLDLRVVITQNFDKIYDVYAQSESNGSVSISHYYDLDTALIMRGDYRGILKVHGTIDQPSKTVFTRKEYAELRNRHKSFQSLIDALFLTHTFLFLGCSLSDPDLKMFFENHSLSHPSSPRHYMTSPAGEVHVDLDDSIKGGYNLELLRYDPAEGHRALDDSLEELVRLTADARNRIAETQNW
jgi:hypothetical protein